MNKAVFLDRDGVLIKERGDYNFLPEHFIINEGVADALNILLDKNFLLIVVSNQSGIGKGVYSYDDVEQFHQRLRGELKENGISISEIYYCPHHPDSGLCLCRKPLPLMLEKAIARFEINTAESFLIGDAKRDIEAATAVGVKSFLMKPNTNLLETVKNIIQ